MTSLERALMEALNYRENCSTTLKKQIYYHVLMPLSEIHDCLQKNNYMQYKNDLIQKCTTVLQYVDRLSNGAHRTSLLESIRQLKTDLTNNNEDVMGTVLLTTNATPAPANLWERMQAAFQETEEYLAKQRANKLQRGKNLRSLPQFFKPGKALVKNEMLVRQEMEKLEKLRRDLLNFQYKLQGKACPVNIDEPKLICFLDIKDQNDIKANEDAKKVRRQNVPDGPLKGAISSLDILIGRHSKRGGDGEAYMRSYIGTLNIIANAMCPITEWGKNRSGSTNVSHKTSILCLGKVLEETYQSYQKLTKALRQKDKKEYSEALLILDPMVDKMRELYKQTVLQDGINNISQTNEQQNGREISSVQQDRDYPKNCVNFRCGVK